MGKRQGANESYERRSRKARSSGVRFASASRSGRSAAVRRRLCSWRQRSILVWWPREQYIGNAHAAILRRTRVLRIFEQPIIEALVNRTALVAEHAIEPTHDRIDDHHRSELAAREHIITDRDRLVRQGIGTLIDAPHNARIRRRGGPFQQARA